MNVYLHSLGCRLNQSKVETLARQFAAAGYAIVDDAAQADICVVNTYTLKSPVYQSTN